MCVDDARFDIVEDEEERIEQLAVGDPAVVLHAGFTTRCVSGLIDLFVIFISGVILAAIFWLVTGQPPTGLTIGHIEPTQFILFYAIYLLLILGYLVLFIAAEGQTIGKQAMRIAVVEEDGTTPSLWTSFVRTVYSFVSLVCLGIGFFIIIGDPDKQAWHDRWAKTYVISLDEATERL